MNPVDDKNIPIIETPQTPVNIPLVEVEEAPLLTAGPPITNEQLAKNIDTVQSRWTSVGNAAVRFISTLDKCADKLGDYGARSYATVVGGLSYGLIILGAALLYALPKAVGSLFTKKHIKEVTKEGIHFGGQGRIDRAIESWRSIFSISSFLAISCLNFGIQLSQKEIDHLEKVMDTLIGKTDWRVTPAAKDLPKVNPHIPEGEIPLSQENTNFQENR